MMKNRIVIAAVAAFVVSVAGSAASAATVVPSNLNGYLSVSNNPLTTKVFETRARHGGSGWTHGIRNPMTGVYDNTGTFTSLRSNGNTVPFSISYDGDTLTYTVGSNTRTGAATGNVTDLWFKANNNGSGGQGSSVVVSDLFLNGGSLGGSSVESFGGENFFFVSSGSLGENFTLTGNITLSWASTPSHEGLKFEVIAFSSAVLIPLPGAAGMALAGMGLIGLRRRR